MVGEEKGDRINREKWGFYLRGVGIGRIRHVFCWAIEKVGKVNVFDRIGCYK